jgi:hypothetical protein
MALENAVTAERRSRRGALARFERGPAAPRSGPWLTGADLVLIATLFLTTRLAIWAVAALVALSPGGGDAGSPAETLIRWDARWYVEIAQSGYPREAGAWETGDGVNWPFFPALPLLIAGAMRATGLGAEAAGLLAAHGAFLLSLVLFFLYARDLFGRPFARVAATVFALWPFSVHQSVPMSESLSAPLLTAVFWLARRGWLLRAGLAAAALSATRAPGAFVAFPLLALAARAHGLGRILLAAPGTERAVVMLASCGVGIGAFILYMHAHTGDGLAFAHAQTAWGREAKWPWWTVWDALFAPDASPGFLGYHLFNLGAVALALALAAGLLRMRLGAEALFVVLIALLGLAAGQTTSLARFMGALPPLALPVALMIARGRVRRGPALFGLGLAMLTLSALWCAEAFMMM